MRFLPAIVLACAAACGRSERKPPDPTPKPVAADAAVVTPDAPPAAGVITVANRQLLVGVIPDWSSTTAELRLWTRDINGPWRIAMESWPAVIGTSGAAWGTGLHGNGAPKGHPGDIKREGDGKSPAGVFAITNMYGYAPRAPATDLPYQAVNENWQCVDDPASQAYNTILDKRTQPNDWKSAEEMRRKDALYTWVVEIAHNAERKPGDGSCIFLHVWRDAKGATVGCTAMEQKKLEELAGKLAPIMRPAYVLLPRAEYDALAASWGLPTP